MPTLTPLALAVAALPQPDQALVPLLRIPAEEIAALRLDPGSADLMLRHRIAHALRTTRADDPAALALAQQVWDAAQLEAQEEVGRLIEEGIAEGISPEEMKRRMFELFARHAGPCPR